MPIPKRIIQTAQSVYSLRRPSLLCQESLLKLHPDYEMMFFSGSERREFVKSQGNGFLDLYDFYRSEGHQAALFSVLAVYSLGGFFFHTDLQMHSCLNPLLAHSLVLTEERLVEATPAWHQDGTSTDEPRAAIGIYGFAGEAGCWFLDKVLSEMANRAEILQARHLTFEQIQFSKADDIFTCVYHQQKTEFSDKDCVLRGSERSRWNEFGEYGSHILDNEM